ncbi:hypothetical protein M427DRAFT_98379 [Gonapodya prolifera JEL478]|uniref:RING-type domain-containing protein n=1 Tax=Gonapodya prolifera (strain JEL478) TaxID=1344416 RepID=A0A139AGQ2_GONPJ|nr:hypothetical protein M427DRAFT_98379 [Gonapodya prolifera JEL478]|eukprot:KXS15930.1 hypothetical protein M427DRAFT_98379 [Gonapodya prolifera JEL478]
MALSTNPSIPAYDSDMEDTECPLCMEEIDVSDQGFKPCPCGYQICRFCWHHIRENLNGLCPACRRPYTDEQVEFTPMSGEEVARRRAAKKAKERERKEQELQQRKHLASIRVVQRNLIYVVGLPPRVGGEEILRSTDYFGQFGKVTRAHVNRRLVGGPGTNGPVGGGHGGLGGQPLGVYIAFTRKEDAAKAIKEVEGTLYEGRMVRATHGTTKYCAHYLRGQTCPNPNCVFLHEHGDPAEGTTEENLLLVPFRGQVRPAPFPPLEQVKRDTGGGLPATATW